MPTITGQVFVILSVRDARRSADWYADLLGMEPVREFVHADGRVGEVVLRHPASGLELALSAHEGSGDDRFDERRIGLDHLEFVVSSREVLVDWEKALDARGIVHSGIKEPVYTTSAMITFRDPDNIQLEFYWRPG